MPVSTQSHWVHDLSPFLLRFPDNPLGLEGIRYYGLAYLLGFFAAWLLLRLYDKRGIFALNADERANLMTAVILGVLIGGRIGYCLFYEPSLLGLLRDPGSGAVQFPFWGVLAVNQGGMASHGGFIGVILGVVWFARHHRKSLFEIGDAIASVASLGLFFGRIANFINGELWGRVSTVPWAVIFPDSTPVFNIATSTYAPLPRHPSQLYQAALEGLLLFAYMQWRVWTRRPTPAGQLGGEYLIGYGVLRIVGELFREPDASLILGLSRGQFYSIFVIAAGIAVIALSRKGPGRLADAP